MSTVAALHARIPSIDCKRKCQAYCGAIIQLGAYTEAERPGIEQALSGVEIVRPAEISPLACSALDRDGLCAIHAARPAICRFFGVVEGLECPHGCVPERLLSHAEMTGILNGLKEIAGPGRFAEAQKSVQNAGATGLIEHLADTLFES
jgi:uncharacterized protein